MSDESRSSSSVGIVAIVAVLVLALAGAWFIWGRSGNPRVSPPAATGTTQQDDADITVKVDMPDSVTIKK